MGSSHICTWLWYAHKILDDHRSRVEDTNINSYCNDVGSGGIGSDSCYEEQEDPSINEHRTGWIWFACIFQA